tara:strand:- start:273 stop:497 length:225 start_codon:yes stop_codon:yes gene_type:complete
MPEMDGWFETENGLEPFLIEASSLEAAVLEMIDYDKDFGHTDMEITWDDKDVTKQVYDMAKSFYIARKGKECTK